MLAVDHNRRMEMTVRELIKVLIEKDMDYESRAKAISHRIGRQKP
jgi:hypothetical protein